MGAWEDGYAARYRNGLAEGMSPFYRDQDRGEVARKAIISPPKRKRVGKAVPGMAAALRKANKMARKKNGDFKKGWNQAKVMKKAHQIRRRRK